MILHLIRNYLPVAYIVELLYMKMKNVMRCTGTDAFCGVYEINTLVFKAILCIVTLAYVRSFMDIHHTYYQVHMQPTQTSILSAKRSNASHLMR